MAAVLNRAQQLQTQSEPPSPHLTLNTSFGKAVPVPNKHIPFCPAGPEPAHGLPSPPASPPSKQINIDTTSILYPPTAFHKISESPAIYAISAAVLAEAIDHIAAQPLPDPQLVFPWLHGLHADNHFQLSFFDARKKSSRKIPRCIRGLTIVKTGSDLSHSKVKGAVAPEELLLPADACKDGHAEHCEGGPCFHDPDPKLGFGVRNFQIQACKMATISDIVVYGDDLTSRADVIAIARVISRAQKTWSSRIDIPGCEQDKFNTFVVTDSFATIEANHSDLVASNAAGMMNEKVMDFFHQERVEMHSLSKASEIVKNVWLGPTPDPTIFGTHGATSRRSQWDVLVEATDFSHMPEAQNLADIERFLGSRRGPSALAQLDVPSSGSTSAQGNEENIQKLINLCRWIHKLANPDSKSGKPSRRFLIHCADGYTETSMLALAYYMYSEGIPAHEAWVRLHREKGRNFFAYPTDKVLFEAIQMRLLKASPKRVTSDIIPQPTWMKVMDGSFPSRIMPYLYLGNLTHASNPGLLRQLGIKRVLSVGEPITWNADPARQGEDCADWPAENFLYIDKVQDNGVDPLTGEFGRCLEFIGEHFSIFFSVAGLRY